MSTEIRKFQTLELNQPYEVLSHTEPIKGLSNFANTFANAVANMKKENSEVVSNVQNSNKNPKLSAKDIEKLKTIISEYDDDSDDDSDDDDDDYYYYILLVSEEGSDEPFELYSTPLLYKYIKERKSIGKFRFIVKESKGTKYPFIEGYSKERKWTVLE